MIYNQQLLDYYYSLWEKDAKERGLVVNDKELVEVLIKDLYSFLEKIRRSSICGAS